MWEIRRIGERCRKVAPLIVFLHYLALGWQMVEFCGFGGMADEWVQRQDKSLKKLYYFGTDFAIYENVLIISLNVQIFKLK